MYFTIIKYLKKIYDIDITYDGYLLDFQKIYDEILEKDFNHLIRIEKAIVLSNLSWKKDYPYLNVSFHEGLLENFSLNHFFTKNKNQNTIETKHIFSNDFILNKIFYNLKFSNCLILNVENENIKEYVSTKIILESLLNKKNVGIFTKNTKLFDNIRKKYNQKLEVLSISRNDTRYRREENEEKKNHCHAAGYSTACMWMSADIKSNR